MTVHVEDFFVGAAGGRLFARVWGDVARCAEVAPLVLFHDSLGCVELWRDFPLRLAEATGHPVIAYDRLGFGQSDPHPGALDVDFVRQEARSSLPALREALGFDRMILFGHSVGGAMAVVAAAKFAESTVAVITEAAQAFVEDVTLAAIAEAKAAFAASEQLDRLRRYHGEKAPWVVEAWTETWLHPDFAVKNLDSSLRLLRCPVLAIQGDRDEYGSRAHPERIAERAARGARVLVIPDCGHVPHREKPELVLEATDDFLGS